MSTIQNKIIAVLIVLACVLSFNIGYAKYSNASSVTDIASTNKQLDVQFSNPKIVNIKGANEKESYIKPSADGKSLNLNVSNLAYPGAEVEYSVDIVNTGNYPVIIDNIKTSGFKENGAIKIKGLENVKSSSTVLHSGEKYTFTFSIGWDKSFNTVIEEKTNFSIELVFTQQI